MPSPDSVVAVCGSTDLASPTSPKTAIGQAILLRDAARRWNAITRSAIVGKWIISRQSGNGIRWPYICSVGLSKRRDHRLVDPNQIRKSGARISSLGPSGVGPVFANQPAADAIGVSVSAATPHRLPEGIANGGVAGGVVGVDILGIHALHAAVKIKHIQQAGVTRVNRSIPRFGVGASPAQ